MRKSNLFLLYLALNILFVTRHVYPCLDQEAYRQGNDCRERKDGEETRTDRPLSFYGSKLYEAFVSGRSAYAFSGFSDVPRTFPIGFNLAASPDPKEDE